MPLSTFERPLDRNRLETFEIQRRQLRARRRLCASIEPGVSLEPKAKEPQARVLDLAIPVE